jgi:peroxiredoxin
MLAVTMSTAGWRRALRSNALPVLLASLLVVASAAAASSAPSAAPDFALKALDGRNHRLSEHRGEVVAVVFWGSWCGACRRELERFERLHSVYGSAGLRVLGVVLDSDDSEARSIAAASGAGFPQLHDRDGAVARSYRPRRLPTTLLVDRAGLLRFAYGELDANGERAMLGELRSLLDE